MKKTLLILFLSALLSLSSFAQVGWQRVERTNSSNGQIQQGWVRRDKAIYPNTQAGNTAFYAAVNNGSLTIVLTDPLASTPPSSTTSTPTSPTLSAGSLAFNIVAYNCASGVLQYKLTSNSASSITVSIPDVFAGALAPGSVQNYTFPSDAKVGRTVTGSASQNGNQIAINFVTSCTLGPTTTDPPTTPTGGKTLVVLHGNSIWRCDLVADPNNKIGVLLQASLGSNYDVVVHAANGQTTTQMIAQGAAIDGMYEPGKYTNHILIPFEITNDIFADGGKTAQQAYDNYKSYCLQRKAAKPWKIIVPTVLRRTGSAPDLYLFEQKRQQINTWERSEYTQYGDALSDIGEMGVENSAGFEIDGLHPRDAGNIIIANALKLPILASTTVTNPPSSTYVSPGPSTFDWTPLNTALPPDSMLTFETPYQKAIVAFARRWGNNGGNSITGPRLSGQIYKHFLKGETVNSDDRMGGFSYPSYLHYSTSNPGEGSPWSDGDNFTMGTQYGVGNCIYMNPKPNEVPSQLGMGIPDANTTGLGRNPNPGDDRGNTSLLLQAGYVAGENRYYIKTVPVLYNAYGALAKGTIYEDWHSFTDHLHIVRSRITTNYTRSGFNDGYDKQAWLYDGEQEMPGKYVNGSRDETGGRKDKVIFYNGNSPCSGENPTTINLNARVANNGTPIWTSMRTEAYRVTEPWVFVTSNSSSSAKGTGLILSVSKIRLGNFGSGDDHAERISPNTNTSYVSEKPDIQFENQGTVYYVYKEFFGTLAEIRAEGCKVENRFASRPNYRFNTASKQNWKISTYGDSPVLGGGPEKRTEDHGAQDIAEKGYWSLDFNRSPFSQFGVAGVSWKASECTKIYINMAYTGPNTYWGFSWLRNGQAPNSAPRDNEEAQAFWKGLAPNGQGTNFAVIGDGQRRTYVIDVSGHGLWNPGGSEYINEITLSPHPSGAINGTDHANVYWVSTDPNGPPN